MAEDNQNSEMEDILSSIKNILEEDEQRQKNQNTIDVLDDVLADATDDVDDILELSPDMRIEEKAEVNAELQNDNAPEIDVFADIDLPNNNTTEPEFVIDEPVGTIDDIPEVVVNEEPLPLTDDKGDAFQVEDVSGNAFETTLPEEMPFEDLPDNKEDNFVVEQLNEIEKAPETVEIPVVNETSLVDDVENFEAPTIFDEPVMVEQENVVEIPEVVNEPTTVEVTTGVDDVEIKKFDASSNLISNFAKMFSHEEASVEEKTTVVENIVAVGNAQKTLEEFVLEAITKVIGNEISYKWNKGEDFRTYAEEEINRQISAWVNENLPSMVENIIKQEIQRVIAKVGS